MQSSNAAYPTQVTRQLLPSTAPVHFSLLYQLRHTACSITARNSTSPLRLSGCSNTGHREDSVPGYVTPLRHTTRHSTSSSNMHPTATGLYQRTPVQGVAFSAAQSSPPANWSPNLARRAASHSSHTAASLPLLSTMDRRELSKVVVRDAVYARVLDLVPGRQHVQVAVWTLSPQVIQIDGAVAACALPRDAAAGHMTATASVNDPDGLSAFSAVAAQGVRLALQERLRELALDSNLFASLLKPYLGELGCQGDVVAATVDGAEC